MKVAYLITRSDTVGGASIHVRDCAQMVLDRGHEAVVVVGGAGPFLEQLRERGIPHRSLSHLVRDPFRPWADLRALVELREALSDLDPDLVSGHSTKAGGLGRLAAASRGIPALFTAHGWAFTEGKPRWKQYLYLTAEKVAAPCCERIVTVSDYDRRLALDRGLASPEKLVTVHNGMPDVEDRLRADPEDDPPRLVMVARFAAQKDHPTLIEAMARLRDRDWRLDLVGEGPRMEEIRDQVREAGIEDRVRFLGYRTDVPEILARAQVFLLVSNWEGFPRSILEAMRAGLPVVASDVGGISESVSDGETGYVVPPGEPDPLADRLGALLDDAGRRGAMGRQGRDRYEARFTFERMFEDTFRIYEEVLDS